MSIIAILPWALAMLAAGQSQPAVQFSFRGSGQMKEEDIHQALGNEVTSGGERLTQFETKLKDMYTSLPKNADGLVGHQAVRYALHRHFLHRHGWFIRGLEPGNATWVPQRRDDGSLPPAFVKEWVPTFLQDTIERKGGDHGMNLHEMATMAATLEDLVHKEVETRLKMVYNIHEMSPESSVSRGNGDDILSTYLMSFLLANNLTANSREQFLKKRALFSRRYKGYQEVHDWYVETVEWRLGSAKSVDFAAASQVVHDIGEKFHTFNDLECSDLRSTLRRFESRREGRVRLSTFYNMSRFTHWRFTEKAEWLRTLGALDESDPKNPSVIIPNYVMARPNCLEASNLYAICCRNTCEDLMAHLEREIGHAKTTPDRVRELVAALPSDTVQAPRVLSASLLSRLDQVAAHHTGEVPLHGRLFAQWMHHAYPRECPYPHEAGTINPQTADEWMSESGQASHASDEEMHERIQNDVCAIDPAGSPECGEEEMELPWNPIEELLSAPHTTQMTDGSDGSIDDYFVASCALIAFVVSMSLLALAFQRGELKALPMRLDGRRLSMLALLSLMTLAYSMDLLDGSVFGLTLSGSFVLYIASLLTDRSTCCLEGKGCLPDPTKVV